MTLALPLAVEAHEPGLMRRWPRPPAAALLTRALLCRTVIAAALMTAAALVVYAIVRAGGESAGETAAVTTIVLFQALYLLEWGSLTVSAFGMSLRGNPWVWAGVAGVLLLQAAFVHAPPLQSVFGSSALTGAEWGVSLAAASTVIPVIELEKRWRAARRLRRSH